ncbi:cystathionine gamma-lyase domain protein [Ancylostoma duodenale]|uniref:cystathionine gamma-lyase n=1 Tax=Ancylostoma duodenale TaxID=51022 RepID=A0A0C2G1Y2_9BILA|nr:cystathionine gamma-lyase domain protein [Ancylostoma duodenale]
MINRCSRFWRLGCNSLGRRVTRRIVRPRPPFALVVAPISLSTTYKQDRPGEPKGHDYSRAGNPSRDVLQKCLASLEDGKYCHVFASGLAASMAVVNMLKAGDHIICSDDVYGGTQRFIRRVSVPQHSTQADFVDLTDLAKLQAAFKPNTKMVWMETPSNPLLKVVDIAALVHTVKKTNPDILVVVDNTFMSPYFQRPLTLGADIVVHSITKYINGHSDVVMGAVITDNDDIQQHLFFQQLVHTVKKTNPDILVVVDNTFMSPYFQRPLTLGADIVVHSITKYINGHSDVVMGAVITDNDDIQQHLFFQQLAVGAIPSPFDCFLVNRGLKTLHLRMRAHYENALAIAKYLEANERVEKVLYPALPSHPQHKIHLSQTKGMSGMMSFYLKGGLEESRTFLSSLKIFTLAESLGGYESLAELPSIMTHASVPAEERKKLQITDNLIRLSVGVENLDDLIADLDQALKAAVSLQVVSFWRTLNFKIDFALEISSLFIIHV